MDLINDIQILSGTKKAPGQEKGKSVLAGKQILIVEDDVSLANILEEKLTHEGFSVEKAANGQEGLDKTVALKPNLILLDLMMPIMSGPIMLHRLREMPDFKHLPVIVLTNAGDADNLRDAHFQNAYFLIKSNVSLKEIVKSVRDAI